MAKVVDLKRTPQDKAEVKQEMERGFSESDYPWGSEISFEDIEIEKLGISELDVGQEVTITGTGKITAKSFREVEGGKPDGSMRLQITGLGVEKAGGVNAAKALYGEGDSSDESNKG